MINFNEAKSLAISWIRDIQEPDNELCLVLEETIEKPYGWIFFYNSKQFLEKHDFDYAIAGNAPILVDRNGSIHLTGTAEPIEFYIKIFDNKYIK